MSESKLTLRAVNHRWFSLFFFVAAISAYLGIDESTSLNIKALVVGGCGAIGFGLLLTRSQDRLWIEDGYLCFSQTQGKENQSNRIPINDISAVHLTFSGNRGSNSGVRHKCFVETSNGNRTQLPNGIIFSAYNPKHAKLSFLMTPLRIVKPNIKLIINDDEVVTKSKPDFSGISSVFIVG